MESKPTAKRSRFACSTYFYKLRIYHWNLHTPLLFCLFLMISLFCCFCKQDFIFHNVLELAFICLLLLLLLLLSCFSRVWLCVTPETAAHQAPLSLGFSRQEYWSGLPFPSPMHESEKWKWSRSVVSDSWRPHGLQPTRLLCPWDFPGKSTGVGCHCLLCWHILGSSK